MRRSLPALLPLVLCLACTTAAPAAAQAVPAVADSPPVTAEPAPAANPIDPGLLDAVGPGAELIIAGNRPADFSGPGTAEGTTRSLVGVEGQTFAQAAQVTVRNVTLQAYDSILRSPASTGRVEEGDVLFGVIDVRAESDIETGGGSITVWLEQDAPKWHGFRQLNIAPGGQWQRRFFSVRADQACDAGAMKLVLHLGTIPQEVEVANLLVWNLGPDADTAALPTTRLSYDGQEPDAAWRDAAADRIEANRRGDLAVTVVDAAGKPVPGVEVRAELRRPAFQLGTFVGNRSLLLQDDENARQYKRVVETTFRRVTTAVYGAQEWGWWNPERRAEYMEAIDWARERGLYVKAHNLVWSRFSMNADSWGGLKDDPPALQAAIRDHVTEKATAVAAHGARAVDVLNEPIDCHDFEDLIPDPNLRASWFQAAHAAGPSLVLLVNESGILSGGGLNRQRQDAYAAVIRDLLDRGAPLHAIGFESHIGEDFTGPEKLWEVLDRFAEFGLPLHVTEFDVNTEDEGTQGDYVRDFITAMYAHPAVGSVTLWGFAHGQVYVPNAALWREDWTMKPGAEALVEMSKTLNTDETFITGEAGTATVRGDLGTYTVTANGATEEVELTRDGATVTIQLP